MLWKGENKYPIKHWKHLCFEQKCSYNYFDTTQKGKEALFTATLLHLDALDEFKSVQEWHSNALDKVDVQMLKVQMLQAKVVDQ